MFELVYALFFVAIVFFVLAAIGHVLWLVGAAILKAIFGFGDKPVQSADRSHCQNCRGAIQLQVSDYCDYCGCLQLSALWSDLDATTRVLDRVHRSQRIDVSLYTNLKGRLAAEYLRLANPQPAHATESNPTAASTTDVESSDQPAPQGKWQDLSIEILTPPAVPSAVAESRDSNGSGSSPSFLPTTEETISSTANIEYVSREFTQPRRRFSDMLNSFMEESNIRWGEIIGG
ncbi:MAG TPA: hypothetical protein VLA93_16610, partial [Pyrinomonadaceae bacterium]|nr:hypothetical protein [Pyrinomonadaceae bacterium]